MDMNINQVLNQIRVRSQFPVNNDVAAPKTDFSALLKQTMNDVNTLQIDANTIKDSYEKGNAGIDLPEVMIATQKASLAFEAVTEVRNRVLNAYQEIMNMQV
jgi:flagellar hook-basal body complex protein FliE